MQVRLRCFWIIALRVPHVCPKAVSLAEVGLFPQFGGVTPQGHFCADYFRFLHIGPSFATSRRLYRMLLIDIFVHIYFEKIKHMW